MKTNIFTSGISITALLLMVFMLFTGRLSAQDGPPCERISFECLRKQLNKAVAGDEYELNSLKKLKIHEIESITCNDNKVTIIVRVTLKRYIRRNAKGTMEMTAKIPSASKQGKGICLQDLKIRAFRLSNTGQIGENYYEKFEKKILKRMAPNGMICCGQSK